jgi:acetolactate synthase-1/2/3 large subunit
MRCSDAIWEIVSEYCDTVFFVPGGQAAFLVDSLGQSGLKHISMLHEQGAGFAACGYAQATGKLGVCLTTSGPGATNAITPCWAAWADSIPVLFISGQANLNPNEDLRVRGVQSVDIISIVKPITKWAHQVRPNEIIASMTTVIVDAFQGRHGPCWLDIPLSVQAEEI